MCPPNRGGASVGAGVGRGRGEGRGHETSASSSSSSVAAQKLATEVEAKLTIQSPSPVVASPPSSKALSFPVRPGVGTVGRRCVVKANHFLVTLRERILHHYDVTITPEVISRGVNRAVMRQLVNEYGESHLCRLRPVYDGRKGLFNAGPLPFLSKEFVIKLVDKDGQTSSSAARREREFKVAIKLASRTDLHHLQQFLSGRQRDAPTETIQVLDIVLRESPSNNCTVVRRSFFSEKLGRKSEVGDGMECWRGYYQSIRPTQMGMSLNIDVAATSFYESIPIVDYVLKLLNLRDPLRPLTDIDRTKVKKAVRGLRVELTHTKGVKRHKISGITSQPLDQLTFTAEEGGSRITVPQYFQDKYKIRLKYTHWPTLQDGSDSRPTYLLLEVCKIVEGQRYAKKLNEKQVTAILRASCQRPSEREGNIATMVRHNNYQDDVYAKEFGINVNSRLTLIQGARLKYHDTGREVRIQPRVGQWNMINTLYDIRAMKELESFRGHQKDVTALAWHPFHEEYFVSGSYDGSIFHWLVGHEAPQVEITGAHESSVWDLSWHHVDYLLCIGSNDHTTNFLYRNRPGDFASRDNFRAGHNQGGYGDQNQNPAFLGRAGPNNMAISEPPPTPGPFFYGLPRNEGTVPGLDSSSSDQGGDQKQQGLGLGLPPPPLPPGPHPSLLAPGQHPYQKQQHH